MLREKILIVDDDLAIGRMLKIALEAKGYETKGANTVVEGIQEVALFSPDLVLLDIQLLDGTGEMVLEEIRKWTSVPVIVLSVKNTEQDKIKLLDAGADDFITKPFSMGELLARIRGALRLTKKESGETPGYEREGLKINLVDRTVFRDGEPIRLTRTEFDIVGILLQFRGKAVSHDSLIHAIWGEEAQNEMNSLRVHINQIRKKLEKDPSRPEFLVTEAGFGYRWK